ncbi:MAG: hypothetical protein Q4D56_06580 [Bacteroides sp.]|nr:hypothetical protein [Bacteroides sp.]
MNIPDFNPELIDMINYESDEEKDKVMRALQIFHGEWVQNCSFKCVELNTFYYILNVNRTFTDTTFTALVVSSKSIRIEYRYQSIFFVRNCEEIDTKRFREAYMEALRELNKLIVEITSNNLGLRNNDIIPY